MKSTIKYCATRLNLIRNKTNSSTDDFIIQYRQNNKNKEDGSIDINSLDQRRLVFVSLIGLYQSWRNCPSYLLYQSIFILPLKKAWIYKPLKHVRELQTHLISIFGDPSEMQPFIDLLKWKDSQNLVLWTLDSYDMPQSHTHSQLTHPFWYFLSDKLTDLQDPMTGQKYNPLRLDSEFWYGNGKTEYVKVLKELFFFTQKYDAMKAIISSANSNSIRPIVRYTHSDLSVELTNNESAYDSAFDSDENKEDWFMSQDYDAYDIENDSIR